MTSTARPASLPCSDPDCIDGLIPSLENRLRGGEGLAECPRCHPDGHCVVCGEELSPTEAICRTCCEQEEATFKAAMRGVLSAARLDEVMREVLPGMVAS